MDRAGHLRRHPLVAPCRLARRERRRPDGDLLMLGEQLLEPLGREPLERVEERPLVRPGLQRFRVEEDARAGGAAAALERQRDQVAESLRR